VGVRRILNLLPTELKQPTHKNLLHQPNSMNKKPSHPFSFNNIVFVDMNQPGKHADKGVNAWIRSISQN
jgi:hypothetical protein